MSWDFIGFQRFSQLRKFTYKLISWVLGIWAGNLERIYLCLWFTNREQFNSMLECKINTVMQVASDILLYNWIEFEQAMNGWTIYIYRSMCGMLQVCMCTSAYMSKVQSKLSTRSSVIWWSCHYTSLALLNLATWDESSALIMRMTLQAKYKASLIKTLWCRLLSDPHFDSKPSLLCESKHFLSYNLKRSSWCLVSLDCPKQAQLST